MSSTILVFTVLFYLLFSAQDYCTTTGSILRNNLCLFCGLAARSRGSDSLGRNPEVSSSGLPVRVCHAPGREPTGRASLQSAHIPGPCVLPSWGFLPCLGVH